MSITESPSRASAALVREVRDCRALPGDVDHGIEDRFGPRMAMISGHLFRSATSIRDDDRGVVASALADALYLVYVTPAELGIHLPWAGPSASPRVRLAFSECLATLSSATSSWAMAGRDARAVPRVWCRRVEVALRDMARALDRDVVAARRAGDESRRWNRLSTPRARRPGYRWWLPALRMWISRRPRRS